jgi:thiol-disulfide isomerase/thioredoxin
MVGGTERMLFDTDTGLLISSRTVQAFDNRRGAYQSDILYALKRMSYGAPADASLFKLPSDDMNEVKQLSSWNAARIKKQLAGNPAPELNVTDLQGKPLALTTFRGKIVLIDFWATWCAPCRADGPALEKLYRRYGDKDLIIIGISVGEDRGVVEKFLSEHPHSFPIVLTSENEMPRPYQIGVFPTYLIIDRDGTVATAAEGDRGFADLRKMLKKAGLETE